MRINSLPLIMHFDYKNNKVCIEITLSFIYTNGRGDKWSFKKGWRSDGHSVGYFKHFDAQTMAALCHDQDCEEAERQKSYAIRRQGDKNYKFNLADLEASRSKVLRRYAGVSARAYRLKFTGKLK